VAVWLLWMCNGLMKYGGMFRWSGTDAGACLQTRGSFPEFLEASLILWCRGTGKFCLIRCILVLLFISCISVVWLKVNGQARVAAGVVFRQVDLINVFKGKALPSMGAWTDYIFDLYHLAGACLVFPCNTSTSPWMMIPGVEWAWRLVAWDGCTQGEL
jgi:hypothetical protein